MGLLKAPKVPPRDPIAGHPLLLDFPFPVDYNFLDFFRLSPFDFLFSDEFCSAL